MSIPEKVLELIGAGALFVVNHSGGKDSQAMYLELRELVPADQLVIVHADLGEVEWGGAVEHIKATTAGESLHVCRSRRTLLQMIEERGMFPSPQQRQCTSDLKRGPIERTIRAIARERKASGIDSWGLIVNCMGMRAQESSGRAKLQSFKFNEGQQQSWPRVVGLAPHSRLDLGSGALANPIRRPTAPRHLRRRHEPLLMLLLHHVQRARPPHRRAAEPSALPPLR